MQANQSPSRGAKDRLRTNPQLPHPHPPAQLNNTAHFKLPDRKKDGSPCPCPRAPSPRALHDSLFPGPSFPKVAQAPSAFLLFFFVFRACSRPFAQAHRALYFGKEGATLFRLNWRHTFDQWRSFLTSRRNLIYLSTGIPPSRDIHHLVGTARFRPRATPPTRTSPSPAPRR